MQYSGEDVQAFVREEDVRFIHLSFCDVFGRQKNIAVLPTELERAFTYGIAIDASAIAGFGGEVHSDLFLHPIADSLTLLPWRPDQGKLVELRCFVTYPDGRRFENDTRS
ncbi:MAG: glutamine synthetase beta-grasp domain-containing protein, partial [Oscillospiraceae bacterium]|nr:glutamine synthetase beta-grasp domain-containing protein [Oscillospiraceae bacterium]